MGLFNRTPKQLKALDLQLTSARIALSLGSSLQPAQRERVLQTAPREVTEATAAAASAGLGNDAREMLERARRNPPSADLTSEWSSVIDRAVAVLDGS